jgi:hypothetical protein
MCLSYDGKYMLTAGGSVVHLWNINPHVLAASAKINGLGVDVFFDMVEGATAIDAAQPDGQPLPWKCH